jgi:hypothetical protein
MIVSSIESALMGREEAERQLSDGYGWVAFLTVDGQREAATATLLKVD